MYFTETMFNPEYINPLYFKQQQTQMTQYDFWQDQEVCKAAHAIKELRVVFSRRAYMTFAVLLIGSRSIAAGSGIQGGRTVSALINSNSI